MSERDRFAQTPETGYYAVIFTNTLSDDDKGYAEMATAMEALSKDQPGCLGLESTRDAFGFGITVSYWADEASILAWKNQSKHAAAQNIGMDRWYTHYELRVARIERSYSGPSGRSKV